MNLQYFKEIQSVTKGAFEVAVPPSDNVHKRGTYKTGDGDIKQPVRPGSMDHLKCKSRGLLSNNVFKEQA